MKIRTIFAFRIELTICRRTWPRTLLKSSDLPTINLVCSISKTYQKIRIISKSMLNSYKLPHLQMSSPLVSYSSKSQQATHARMNCQSKCDARPWPMHTIWCSHTLAVARKALWIKNMRPRQSNYKSECLTICNSFWKRVLTTMGYWRISTL